MSYIALEIYCHRCEKVFWGQGQPECPKCKYPTTVVSSKVERCDGDHGAPICPDPECWLREED